ncbi:MAG: anaerobic sulfatase maturase [Planctomycetes bacterium]|nr:anaerobic sulfatase maturase [Planctomycetota bacterium]
MTPFTLLVKPSGSDCNLDCAYCFYKARAPELGSGRQRMGLDTLETLVRQYMGLGFPVAGFAWQGGEPTLMGVDFFRKAVEFQMRYGRSGQELSNTFQTNGVLLDEAWCRFFRENRFLLGISIDGPERFHDVHRVDRAGRGTFARTMRGISICREYGVEFNALIVLNDRNVAHPDDLFRFVVENRFAYVQFIPCLERDPETRRRASFSVTPRQYGDFLCRLFDLWCDYGPDRLNIREFDSLTTRLVLGRHTVCTYSPECGGFLVVEHGGDAFSCEFFVGPEWRLGNIRETPIEQLAGAEARLAFARSKGIVSGRCRSCPYLEICWGGCLKDRTRLGDGSARRESYFCESYIRFFEHALPRMERIAAAVREGRLGRRTRAVESVRMLVP